jgi:hypothetical protein
MDHDDACDWMNLIPLAVKGILYESSDDPHMGTHGR